MTYVEHPLHLDLISSHSGYPQGLPTALDHSPMAYPEQEINGQFDGSNTLAQRPLAILAEINGQRAYVCG